MLSRRARRLSHLGMAAIIAGVITLPPGGPSPSAAERPGVPPEDPWTCPATHPIKGYVSRESGRRVYFLPGGRFYEEASPERCYASEDEARRDGSRPARERAPSMPGDLAQRAVRDVCRQSAGWGRGSSPRDTLTRNPRHRLVRSHEMAVSGSDISQKLRSRGEDPLADPAPLVGELVGQDTSARCGTWSCEGFAGQLTRL